MALIIRITKKKSFTTLRVLGDEVYSYLVYYSDMNVYLYHMTTSGADALSIASNMSIDEE